VITTTLALVYALVATPIYTAKTVILPPQQQQSGASAALASLGALAGMAGAAAGVKSPDEMYVAFFKSHTLQDDLIARFKLKDYFESETQEGARKALEGAAKISSDKKSGLMTIEVDDKDPVFAAKLANAHVEALSRLMGKLAVTEAQQRRAFFELQIQKTQAALVGADTRFRTLNAKGGLPVTDVLAQVSVTASATLRGQIAAKEVELSALRQFATTQNPEMQRIASELSALRGQLAKMEGGGGHVGAASVDGQAAIVALRDVKTQQAVLEVLVKQYEMARVDEAREGPLLQQIDVAQAPEKKTKPKRAMIVMLAGIAGLFLGVMVAFIRRAVRKAGNNPESAGQMAALKAAWTTGWPGFGRR
jgi:tyrosine-protein kinase Etk/Wzc